MLQTLVSKGGKTLRSRRWRYVSMTFLLMGILMTLLYILSHMSMSPADPSASQYFVAYPHLYNFTLNEPSRCQKESPFLVLMIPVEPHNRNARDFIRDTWGKDTTVLGRVVSHYFLLGQSIKGDDSEEVREESKKHRDILQSDFLDSYNNLTIKTMVMFQWLHRHCPNTAYAMKVDTDQFLNVHNLIDMLSKAPQRLYMTGMVARSAPVDRNRNSKWFLPVSAFPDSTYPPYVLGQAYVFSLDLAHKILEVSAHVKAIYIEDVYVGLCMKHLGVSLRDPPNAGLFRITKPPRTSRCYLKSVITQLLPRTDHLLDEWKTFQIC